MKLAHPVLALVVVLGCRSAGNHYYTLVAAPDAEPAAATHELQVDVLPVDVPPEVDRAEIVVREGPGKLTPVDTRSWIAPLSLEIRRAFSDELSRILGARDIAGVTPAAGLPTYRIKLVVQRFESMLGKRAVIDAISTVHELTGARPTLVCSHHASESARPGYDGLAEAHQRALVQIAKQVAASVRSFAGETAACSAPAKR
ncbi:MAG: membrane integrity-associated transporter subunit PqiC [Deltaproteobacteria bacterium]|nr:membrane integrity-associated transporter subunit PqiC [Deltaproteobacteria bacterium]MDQ3299685.1 PqiC family protein [Myxococcota bacterium]